MKTINTLVKDIYSVIEGNGGWNSAASDLLSKEIVQKAEERFIKGQEDKGVVRLSAIGNPRKRQLWLDHKYPELKAKFNGEMLGTFFYGDVLESIVIALAVAAGHKVEGLQEDLNVFGIAGHGDCIIDGVVVDVKSTSSLNFLKFQTNSLREKDEYGYISQLSSYLYGYKDDPRVVTKNKAAFLAVSKERFKLCLDVYDLSKELRDKQIELESTKRLLSSDSMPDKCYDDIPDGKSGNMKLHNQCSWCSWRKKCWPEARAFQYSNGITYLSKVRKLPKVKEIKDANR